MKSARLVSTLTLLAFSMVYFSSSYNVHLYGFLLYEVTITTITITLIINLDVCRYVPPNIFFTKI